MKKLDPIIPVFGISFYLILYIILLLNDFFDIAIFMYLLSPFIMVFAALLILKKAESSDKTFDDYFYDDIHLKRV